MTHQVIGGKIGAGGMGEAWSATDTRLDRPVASPFLPGAFVADPGRHARFHTEAGAPALEAAHDGDPACSSTAPCTTAGC